MKEFFAQFILGPLFLAVGLGVGYEWMFKGAYWTWIGIPVTPVIVLLAFGIGGWITKLGYVDGDVEAIIKFMDKS